MNEVRKVPASAGAEWVLEGFGLLRKAPFGLGLLGALYGLLALLVASSVRLGTGVFMVFELALVIAGPLLMGGIVCAVRDVDQGGRAQPGDLLRGVRGGRAGQLLLTLLPNVAAAIACVVLLYALVGAEALAQLVAAFERANATGQADPAAFAGFPFDRFALWLLLVAVIGITASFFTFVALPGILFGGRGAFEAMGRSFHACVRNLPAFLVMVVLLLIAFVAFYIALAIVGTIVNLVAGQLAMQVVGQLLGTAVLVPVMMGVVYAAWKQMLPEDAGIAATPVAGFEA